MTRDEILNMPAGREMDALIAEKVMGNKLIPQGTVVSILEVPPGTQLLGWRIDENKVKLMHDVWNSGEPKHYSTDISAAWEVVEHLHKTDPFGKFDRFTGRLAEMSEANWEDKYADAFNLMSTLAADGALAICRAALPALEAE